MARIVLGIEYDGSGFAGWQSQAGRGTVQDEVQRALGKVANCAVNVVCAGRTDAGVHALGQVAHFDCDVQRDMRAWVMGGNTQLPEPVRILWAQPALTDFHARYSAIARWYRYVILNRTTRSALHPRQMTWWYYPLQVEKMQEAAQCLVGDHDFSSFRAQGCQSKSPQRQLHFIDVRRDGDRVVIDLAANAFLHHMVRNIAGTLLEIGSGKRPVEWTQQLLQLKDRSRAGITAPADGLYLGGVHYPPQYGIASHPQFLKLPPDAKRFDADKP